MILYSGAGDFDMVTIAVLGDGNENIVDIDLAKPPFSLAFTNMSPRHWTIRMKDGDPPKLVTLSGSRLHLEFDDPLPPPNEGTASPRTQFEFYMWYGVPITAKTKSKRRG